MLQKNRKYFLAGVFLLLTPFLLFSAPVPVPVSKYYPVQFEDAAYSPRAKTIVLINALRREIRNSLPVSYGKKVTPKKFTFLYKKGIPEEIFSIQVNRKGSSVISLPENFDQLLALPGALARLTAWILTASAGMDMALAEKITDSWYVTGIARKLLRTMQPVKSPFTQYFPSAYVLTSHDHYPTLESLLRQELTGEDSCIRLLYEEYSELLVLICLRHGLFRKGLLTALLSDFSRDPDRKDMPLLFRQYAAKLLGEKEKRLFRIREGEEKDSKELFEAWFRQELSKILNWNFLPADVSKIERLYKQALRFEAALKKKKETVSVSGQKKSSARNNATGPEKQDMVRGDLYDLLQIHDKLQDPSAPALSMALAIGKLSRFASPDLTLSLLQLRSSLLAFAAKRNSGTVKAVTQADRDFHTALKRNILLEQFLEETERKVIPPGVRYHVTHTVLRRKYEDQLPTIRHFEELLRKTQRKIQNP